ncbi:lycopene cyclase domain-containing protein [Halovenus salina]|uniref:Lycopene cyclase domain-containing protein n=1 Tax=Halovenus salina TaxID=1510225 RepID=A0ABD5W0X3_9EURY|nr:lycopene cyclase domain-containing protein [Halovenus salina]
MIPPETYFQFHLVFVLPVLVLLVVISWYQGTRMDSPAAVAGLVVILALALGYTTPWDNLLIEAGVWWYGDGVVWETLWAAPVGEYLFFLAQPTAGVLFLCLLDVPTDMSLSLTLRERLAGLLAGIGVSVVGAVLLVSGDSWRYFAAILAWAGPVLAIQWAFGWTYLWHVRRPVAVAIAVPTLYFWVADWAAISLDLWTISDTYTLGIAPFGFPVEEALFFVVTNIFVVQGYALYCWLVAQWQTVAIVELPGVTGEPGD